MILTQELKHLACRTLGLAWKFIKSGLPGYHTLRLRFFGAFLKFGKRTPAMRPSFVAVELSSSAWSVRPAENAMNHRRKRAN
jgi:hypothetical protein